MPELLDEHKLAEVCEAALAAHGCPSVSVAVVADGEPAHVGAWGLADVAAGRAAGPGTAYGLASATKPMTSTAVCLAADEGLLELDAPVPGDFGGTLGRYGKAPTARQLLQHRGGLTAFYAWDYGDGTPPIDADPYTVLHREPGSGFEYANLGYRVLGRLLEDTGGQPLGTFLEERVFAPLGLDSLHVGRHYPGPAPAAVRYTPDGRPYPDYDCPHPGATLGWATATELALFAQNFDRLLKPQTAAAIRHGMPVNTHLDYGLGWCLSAGDGSPLLLHHGGGSGGVGAMLVAVPELRLSVAVLTNSTNKAARDAVLDHVLSALVPGFRQEWLSPLPDDPQRSLDLAEGVWAGRITVPDGELPVELRVRPGARIELRVDGERAEAVASASRTRDLLADLPLQLPTADARIAGPQLRLSLRAHPADGSLAGRLTGTAHAFKAAGDAEGLLGNYLGHAVELHLR